MDHTAAPFSADTYSPASPEFKRLAAFQGDFVVGSARRAMLEAVSKAQDSFVWRASHPIVSSSLPLTCVVVWKRKKGVKYLGSVHGGELPEFYGMSQEVTDKVALDSICEYGSRNLRLRCYYETDRPLQCRLSTSRTPSHPRIASLVHSCSI